MNFANITFKCPICGHGIGKGVVLGSSRIFTCCGKDYTIYVEELQGVKDDDEG